jgi:hypothetical protein
MGNTLTVFGIAISPQVLSTVGYVAAGAIGWAVRHWFPAWFPLVQKIINLIQPTPPADPNTPN